MLRDKRHKRAQLAERNGIDRPASDADAAGLGLIEPHGQRRHRGLTDSGPSDERHRRTCRDRKAEIIQNLGIIGISESQILVFDAQRFVREVCRFAVVGNLPRHVDQFEEPARRA